MKVLRATWEKKDKWDYRLCFRGVEYGKVDVERGYWHAYGQNDKHLKFFGPIDPEHENFIALREEAKEWAEQALLDALLALIEPFDISAVRIILKEYHENNSP